MDKNRLREIANETLSFVENKGYEVMGMKVKLHEVEKGRFQSSEALESIDVEKFKVFEETTIEVVNESTVDAVFRLKDNKLGVLNFASAYHPGGGFLNGSVAQEECLAYCSNLYDTLKGNEYYKTNQNLKTKMYSDNMITGNVEFFRTSDYNLVWQPKIVKVITSAAVNMCQVVFKNEDEVLAQQTMKNRMRKVLKLFAKEGCEVIVLGAFGCGVFRNNPEDVATYWVELLEDEGFSKYFKKIVFSIYDKPNTKSNFSVFRDIIQHRGVF